MFFANDAFMTHRVNTLDKLVAFTHYSTTITRYTRVYFNWHQRHTLRLQPRDKDTRKSCLSFLIFETYGLVLFFNEGLEKTNHAREWSVEMQSHNTLDDNLKTFINAACIIAQFYCSGLNCLYCVFCVACDQNGTVKSTCTQLFWFPLLVKTYQDDVMIWSDITRCFFPSTRKQ